ncbi:MAG: hypothetical protein E7505_00785 [Ruminococcus sp.]|nr:hypothetical protein [Ruminococcus sp.]
MVSYTDKECLICKKKFTDSEDLIVCPECGTPYHRSCYLEKKSCINYALHETGGSWMAEEIEKKKAEEELKKECPQCSHPNPPEADKCAKCFSELDAEDESNNEKENPGIELDLDSEYFGLDPNEVMDEETGITIGEMADYAKTNRLYYMLMFSRLKKAAVKFSVNILAFLFPEYYCGVRKMYLLAFVIVVLRLLLQIPADLEMIIQLEEQGAPFNTMMYQPLMEYVKNHRFSPGVVNTATALEMALKVVFGLVANQLYFMHTILKIKKIRGNLNISMDYRATVKQAGGTSYLSILVVLLVEVFLVCIFFFILMSLAYF